MKIIVNAHKCDIDKTPVNEKEINITKCEFEFAEEITNEFVKEAYFTLGKGETYKQIIVNNECNIPGEVLEKKGTVEIGVVAKLVEGTTEIKRYNPSPAYFNTWQGSLRDAENSEPITPSEFDQYEQALQDGLSEVNQKLVDIDEAIEDVNEAIAETNNLDLDVSKSGKIATVTLTKKDATTKVVTLSDGTSLMFNWDGTKLGIKTDEDAEYTYVDLQGIQGPIGPKGEAFTIKKTYTSVAEMNADFNNMQLGDYVMIASTVEVEDNAKLYTRGEEQWIFISDFSGATGIRGETGLTPNIQIGTVTSGETPSVTRTGTNENPVLNFTLVKGDKGDTGNTGATGNGIASVAKTSTSGLVDTYTITYTDASTSTFTVTNGNGIASIVLLSETTSQKNFRINYTNGTYFDYSLENGEVTQAAFDALKSDVEDLRDNQIISDEIEGTEIHLEDAAKARLYEFELEKESSQETTTGKNLLPFPFTSTSKTENGITWTVNEDGSITISGTATGTSFFQLYSSISNKIITDTTKTYTVQIGRIQRNIILSCFDYANGSPVRFRTDKAFDTYGTTFTPTTNGEGQLFRLSINSGYTVNATIYPIIVEGSYTNDLLDFEEYTGGQSSPNPDYPQEVKTVKGYRNLFDKTDTLKQISGYFGGSDGKSILSYPTNTIIYIPTQEGKTYTVTKKYGISSLQRATTTVVPTVATGILSNVAVNLGKSFTYTIPSGVNYLLIFVQGSADLNEYTKDEILSGIQIVEGVQELPYVPYGNNYIYVRDVGKNIFNKDEVIRKDNYYLDANNVEQTSSSSGYMLNYIKVNPNTTYTISGNITQGISTWGIYCYNINQEWIEKISISANTLYTFTTPINCKYLRLQYRLANIDFNTIMIEEGSTATTYEPYKETNVPIPLNGNEIAGIGNYLDELIVDKTGNLYLNKLIGKVVLDGSESDLTYNTNREDIYFYHLVINDAKNYTSNTDAINIDALSNYFKGIEGVNWHVYLYQSVSIISNKRILFGTKFTTLPEFKTWLSTHNTEVYYVLETPQLIDLNTTVDLKLFKGVNNITNSEDANMRIRYVESIDSVINEIEDIKTRLTALEGTSL